MSDHRIRYVTSEQLLFLSPWKPVETDTSSLERSAWTCPNCTEGRTFFRSLVRLEGSARLFMIQCPGCDHLIVVRIDLDDVPGISTQYGGPHIDRFLAFLDLRSRRGE